MNTVFADFETFFDRDYSLRKMTPVEYILDPRFEAIGCAFKYPTSEGYKSEWIEGPDLPKFLATLDPAVTHVVTHNALFDMCIFAWRYGFVPRLMTCTLSASRACLGHLLKRHSLESVARHLGLGVKGTTLGAAVGMHLADIKAVGSFYLEYVAYALNDVELCAGIYDKLVRSGVFPMSELLVMDMVLRCAVNPKFRLDPHVLAEHLAAVQAEKQQLLSSVGVDKSLLMSNDKFAELLRARGVEPPTKVSPVTQKVTYAFAKTDRGMIELEEHEDPAVQALVAARVGHKSTIEETRTQRLLAIAQLDWGNGQYKALAPIALRFSGAHTHRLSGDWKLNWQNLGRKSRIRRALIAPPGHTVVAADAAQIEARGVAAVCGQDDLVGQFARGEDVYSLFAADVFGHPVNKKDHPDKRFVGKVNILQLGYQSGWMTLQNAIRVQSKLTMGAEMRVSDEEAQRYVRVYRSRFDRIPAGWNILNTVGIDVLAHGGSSFKFGPCVFEKGSILLPNGLRLFYHDLRRRDGEWWFTYAEKPEKIYGGKLMENIVQALSRIANMDAAVRIQKRLAELALQVHDEFTYVVPDELVPTSKEIISEEMCKPPAWLPTWPLAVEINTGKSYGDAK